MWHKNEEWLTVFVLSDWLRPELGDRWDCRAGYVCRCSLGALQVPSTPQSMLNTHGTVAPTSWHSVTLSCSVTQCHLKHKAVRPILQWLVLTVPTHRGMARLSWPGWLVIYRDKSSHTDSWTWIPSLPTVLTAPGIQHNLLMLPICRTTNKRETPFKAHYSQDTQRHQSTLLLKQSIFHKKKRLEHSSFFEDWLGVRWHWSRSDSTDVSMVSTAGDKEYRPLLTAVEHLHSIT